MSGSHETPEALPKPLIMSAVLAVRIGAKDIPFDKYGSPIPLQPPRPTLLVWAVEDKPLFAGAARWMYWDILPGAYDR